MQVNLRSYQYLGVECLREKYQENHRSVLYVLPTGGGKTVIFCHIAEKSAERGNRIAILVHRQELVDQTSRALKNLDLDHAILSAGKELDLQKKVHVCSVQTLVRRLNKIPPDFFNLLVIDEAHHAAAGSWGKVIDYFPQSKVLGVTATPERLDGKGLKDKFSAIVIGPQLQELTDQGFLSPTRIFAPPTEIDTSLMRKRMGEFRSEDVEEQTTTKSFVGDTVKHYLKYLSGKTAIAFCSSIKHSKMVAAEFNANGIVAEALDGNTPSHLRQAILTDLSNGIIKVVTSCQIISEGFDAPSVGGCLLLRPTLSLSVFLQQVGRCLRPAEGKEAAIILDHVGNVKKHGFPSDFREWSLEGRQKKTREKESVPIKVCPQCFAVIPPNISTCPECCHVFRAKDQKFVTIEGELVELNQISRKTFNEKNDKREVAKATTIEELQAIASKRGYKSGWAYHIFNMRKSWRAKYNGFQQ